MHRLVSPVVFALLAGLAAGACSKSSTSPSKTDPNTVVLGTLLLPQNENPPVSNDDKTGSGQVTITLHLTKDAAGNVTAATADYLANLSGFPANTTITGAHIHQQVVGVNGSIVAFPAYTSGELVLTNGSGTLNKPGQNIAADVAQNIVNNPVGFYFNVHTTANLGGAARGQLAKQ